MPFLAELDFEGLEIRVLGTSDNPWWVAADVCRALGIENVSLAVTGRLDRPGSGLDEDERGIANVNTPSGEQQMLVINESGLYSLILSSRKPEAKKFKKWITSEVLPNIRKTGEYSVMQVKRNSDAAQVQLMFEALQEQLNRLEERTQRLDEVEQELAQIEEAGIENPGCASILKDDETTEMTSKEYCEATGLDRRHWNTIATRAAQFQRVGKGEEPTRRRNNRVLLEVRYLRQATKSVLNLA